MRAEPLASGGAEALPEELAPRRLLRRLLQVAALVGVLVLVALLAPGLGEVRERLDDAAPGWLAVAVALEASVVRLVRAHVPAGLLPANVVADECADRVVGARRRLARARQRRGRPRARRVDPAPRRDARRAHRAALGGVLSDQELGQLRGGRGAGHAHGGGARRA